MKYRNPWYGPRYASPEYYTPSDKSIVYTTPCKRGQIVKIMDRHYDHLIDGRVVKQLCGKNPELLIELIKAVDGENIDYLYASNAIEAYNKGE